MDRIYSLWEKLTRKSAFFKATHETVVILLAIASLVFAVHDIYYEYSVWMHAVDLGIWFFFVVDYSLRMERSRNKWRFFLHNIPDTLTILPFVLTLRALRFCGVPAQSPLIKVLECTRAASLLLRILKYCMKIMRTHGIRFVILVTALVVASGGVAIHYVEGLPIIDSLWWAFVTAATVGYGDLSPSTNAGRMVAVLLMVMGIGLIGSLTSTITSAFLSAHKKVTVQSEVKGLLKSRLDRLESMDAEEVEQLCAMIRALHQVSRSGESQDADK